MKPTANQYTVLFMLLFLVLLEAARSQQVRNFFTYATSSAQSAIGATAHNQVAPASTAQGALDWHLLLYWGVAGLLVLALADVAPTVVTAVLFLIILEELLVHWTTYAALINIPTK